MDQEKARALNFTKKGRCLKMDQQTYIDELILDVRPSLNAAALALASREDNEAGLDCLQAALARWDHLDKDFSP